MVEKNETGLPLDTDNATERALWQALGAVDHPPPSATLRQRFYARLDAASRPGGFDRLREWLGLRGAAGWVTAAACLLAGIGTGLLVSGTDTDTDAGARLAALEDNVTLLNRRLILDRLENDTPSKRLRGVLDAAAVAGSDAQITRALLARATEDRVGSVRAAAIDALGPNITAPAVSQQLLPLLEKAQSPIVQLALIDLVLRYGNATQLGAVRTLAKEGRLHPDLQRYVINAFEEDNA